ncbi:ATP-binding protein [Gilvimarinus sp. 1_MG-2023]|uniref:ATP-binding protein n=1 Tax=Gilvimarinus sp. 1_MG-2023 TaxID=3062638 RepID=UPI0026E447D8|nr:ATP-binding protein [Gilvimarinus sp. 1_MG-2023]MDO6748437.1 ATP-binding protein [Gilvimarinus sp. 1_MG-2023]
MKITAKLFLTFLAVISCVILANVALARWSFQQGFLDFINELERERLTVLGQDLEREYDRNDASWEGLTFNRLSGRATLPIHPRRGVRGERHPPPLAGRKPAHETTPPTALYDADGNWLMGHVPEQANAGSVVVPVFYNEAKVGELRSWPEAPGAFSSASEFSRKQLMASLFIALLSLALAGIISWFVARRLLKPVKSVLHAVGELSKGDYETSLPDTRRDELGELMLNISELGRILRADRTANQRWFANISHELRTPLTILKGEIETLQAGIRPFDQQQLKSFAHEIDLLNHLVDDLYQISLTDIGALRYQFEHLNLSELIESLVPSFTERAANDQLKFEYRGEPNLWAEVDPLRFKQLLLNLTANSCLYTDAPGTVRLTVRQDQSEVYLVLEDSAPGAELDNFEQLFAPLHRQDYSRQRHATGAGLGLSICRSIVDAHRGEISAAASELGGLKVSIRLNKRRVGRDEH